MLKLTVLMLSVAAAQGAPAYDQKSSERRCWINKETKKEVCIPPECGTNNSCGRNFKGAEPDPRESGSGRREESSGTSSRPEQRPARMSDTMENVHRKAESLGPANASPQDGARRPALERRAADGPSR